LTARKCPDRPGDASPRRNGDSSPQLAQLSAEGKLRRAVRASRGARFANGTKRDEPQDRQRPEIGSQGRGGETVEVVRNHEDGTRMGRHSHPEGQKRRSGNANPKLPGRRTPRLERWRGDLWTSQERQPGLRTGWQGPECVGQRRQGQEGRAHLNVSEGERTGR
jgi:hypothetical protein